MTKPKYDPEQVDRYIAGLILEQVQNEPHVLISDYLINTLLMQSGDVAYSTAWRWLKRFKKLHCGPEKCFYTVDLTGRSDKSINTYESRLRHKLRWIGWIGGELSSKLRGSKDE